MYCYNCKREIPETANFCPYCAADQRKKPHEEKPPEDLGGGHSPWPRRVLIGLAAALLVIAGLFAVRALSDRGDDPGGIPQTTVSAESQVPKQTQRETKPTGIATVPTESQIPEDGWYTENGNRYYICDGQKYVDIQEIDGEYYYFDEDGVLAVDQDVRYGDFILHSNRDGCLEGITIDEIFGEWAEESYHFGYGGSSSILELSIEVTNCDSFRFCLESSGLHGAKVNGTWKIYIRHNGTWEFVQDIVYTQPEGTFDIEFKEPKTFDAITAHPTVQGNASYSSLFYLQNVHCIF